jgi:hypothetical protein
MVELDYILEFVRYPGRLGDAWQADLAICGAKSIREARAYSGRETQSNQLKVHANNDSLGYLASQLAMYQINMARFY